MTGPLKILFAYILIGIVTFGHAASRHPEATETEFSDCIAARNQGANVVCLKPDGVAALSGAFAGIFWPAYWSWELWEW